MSAVSLKGVSKSFRIFPRQRHRLIEAATLGMVRHGRDFWALSEIDLEIERGSTLGVVGRNGAGKSTLLQVVSGILQPTRGMVEVRGQLVLLQMGAGFNPDYTGRENIMLNGLILGIDRKKMLDRFDEIEAFADIGEFMDQPVKMYSSGMRARLGFAVAVNVDPDILVVDETLSVGDAVFRQMGIQRMRELRDRGTTILFVSHGLGMVKNFCTEGALLHEGRLIHHGDVTETLDRYQAMVSSTEAQRGATRPRGYGIEDDEGQDFPEFGESPETSRRAGLRHGTGEARISRVEALNERGAPFESVTPEDTVTIRAHLEYLEDVEGSTLGITLRNKTGLDVFSTTTALEKNRLGPRSKGERVIVDFTLKLPLQRGAYSVTAFITHARNKQVYLDWVDVATAFKIMNSEELGPISGLFHIPTTVEIHTPDPKT